MEHRKGIRSFVLFNLATTAVEAIVLMLVLLWLLSKLGMNVHLWIIILLAVVWGAWSYLTYRFEAKTIEQIPVVGVEALIGVRCRTTTLLSPGGYVRVDRELWRAN
jgi:hypothetical protein